MYTQYSKITFETGILRIGREQDWHDGHMAGDTIGLWPGASARSPWPVPSEPRGTALLAGPAVSSEGPFFPHAFPIRPRSREQKQTSSVWMKMKRFTPAADDGHVTSPGVTSLSRASLSAGRSVRVTQNVSPRVASFRGEGDVAHRRFLTLRPPSSLCKRRRTVLGAT